MTPKPLIIGEAPGKHGDPRTPIEGRIGARLAEWCGLPFDEFLTTFQRINLLEVQPQDSGKGTDFNVRAAGKVARAMQYLFEPGQVVIVLGKRAGAAFGFTNIEYFQKATLNGAAVYVVPHPSGVNRWFNEPENELTMIRFMRGIVKQIQVAGV